MIGAWWAERVAALEAAFPGDVPDDFLSHPAVLDAGIVVSDDRNRYGREWVALPSTAVDVLGPSPSMADVHQMRHLVAAGWPDIGSTVVEWGGGYGHMAALTRRDATPPRHRIIDLPIMHRIQHHYLCAVGARRNVWLYEWDDVDRLSPADTFIACYSLDESPLDAHRFVIDEHDWFGASTILVAAQTTGRDHMFPDGPALVERLRSSGFTETPTATDGSSYFRMDR